MEEALANSEAVLQNNRRRGRDSAGSGTALAVFLMDDFKKNRTEFSLVKTRNG